MSPKKIKCLLIEEDHEDVEIFKIALDGVPVAVEVIAFPDCDSAIKLIEENALEPDCVFLDAFQLRMTDNECLEKIQQLEKIAKAPIVVLAADPTLIDESKFKDTTVAKIIYKESSIVKYKDSLGNFFKSNF